MMIVMKFIGKRDMKPKLTAHKKDIINGAKTGKRKVKVTLPVLPNPFMSIGGKKNKAK